MINRPILTVLMLLVLVGASAQKKTSDGVKPQWIHKAPTPTNSTFRYEVITAVGNSLDAARQRSLSELISNTGLSNGVLVTSDYRSSKKVKQQWNNGKLTEVIDRNSEKTTSAKSKENEIFVENIDEYWIRDNDGDYYLTKLYAISELDRRPLFDNVELTTKYGVNGLWRSAIVPGWGQFYKGSNLKGGLILGGTVGVIAGVIYTDCQRSDYVRKIGKTHNADIKKAYATKRDHFTTGRNVCIGALAALYVYNLIDAVVAPGARRVVVSKRDYPSMSYMIAPGITEEGYPALAASITF